MLRVSSGVKGRLGMPKMCIRDSLMAIPADAKAADNAYAFIDYLLRPEAVSYTHLQRAGERTWQVRYGYDFATVGVPGLTFNTIYLSGDKIKTARGDQSEWERDISLALSLIHIS